MRSKYMPWYALAIAAVVIGAIVLGAPASTVLIALALLACPVMMMFMMGGMGGGHGRGSNRDEGDTHRDTPEQRDSAGRP